MKKILLVATGGTIASRKTENGLTPAASGEELLAAVPEISDVAIDTINLFALDSTNVCPRHWQKIAGVIAEKYGAYDGIVVTHGTDTMAYTAAALYYMLENIPVPVAVTGSMLPLSAENTDAKENLAAALRVAASERPGVYLVFAGKIILGKSAKKLYAENKDAFSSINHELAGEIERGEIKWREPAKLLGDFLLHSELNENVAVLKATPGMSPEIIRALVDAGYGAIIIEGFGAGGLPSAEEYSFLPALKYAKKRNTLIILTTQCVFDGANLDIYEVGVLAERAGVISGGSLTTEALLALSMLVLGEGKGEKLREFIAKEG